MRKDWFKLVQKQLQARTFTLNAKTTVIKSSGKEVEKVVKSQTGAKFSGEKLKSLMNNAKTTQDQWDQVVIPKVKKEQMSKKWKTLIEFLKKNGIAASIAPALYASVKAAFREVLSEMPMQGGGDVYLDGVKVTKEVVSTAKKISKSTGTSRIMA